ncbi:MAG: hypothetical protein ACE5I2_16540 [Anaerolineae bacterium]
MEQTEKDELRQQQTLGIPGLPSFLGSQEGFVLVATLQEPIEADARDERWLEVFNNTIDAMRLTGPGAVAIDRVLAPGDEALRLLSPFWPPPRFLAPRYRLTEKSVGTLDALSARLPLANKGAISMAISRFSSAYYRNSREDELIDVWVALEALFSPTDRRELTYRIPLRVAHYIGSSADEQEHIYNVLLDSYDLRSSVVHGRPLKGQTKKLKMRPGKVIEETEDYLRRALRSIIISEEEFDSEELDVGIARGRETRGN